ncbi:MAG: GAF domain-containing protein, partial [Anaerolineales bacterium]|nr:GAF domain-containing protein [Anaerolineales bacterium]
MAKNQEKPVNRLIGELKERAKELNCLYAVQEALAIPEHSTEFALTKIISVIPSGWKYPEICVSQITVSEHSYHSPNFKKSPWGQHAEIILQDQTVGRISVYYTEEKPELDEGPFLSEERRLINTIANQVGNFLLHQHLEDIFEQKIRNGAEPRAGWQVILGLL